VGVGTDLRLQGLDLTALPPGVSLVLELGAHDSAHVNDLEEKLGHQAFLSKVRWSESCY